MSTAVSEVHAVSIFALMEVTRASETSVDIKLRTRQYISEDSGLQDLEYVVTYNSNILLLLSLLFK
jgi:chlorite dismutase